MNFDLVDAHPRPARPGGVHIVIGGHSPAVYRRTVAKGHGWTGNGSSPEDLLGHAPTSNSESTG